MEIDEVEIIELELKYCERCGGLWLRPVGNQAVYCNGCTAHALPGMPGHKPRPLTRRPAESDIPNDDVFQAMATAGLKAGNA